jgi:uncharacterized membrane protein required for colicin V production
MIAAATQNLASGRMLFNWFDVALILILGFGSWRGRKRGMSREFLSVTQWVTIVFAAGLGNEWLGDQFIQWGLIRNIFQKHFHERTAAYISSYLVIAVAVCLVFTFLKRRFKAKLEGSNAFGSGEYYLGITCGLIRYGCMTTCALALLSAPFYSLADINAQKAYNNRWYGGGMKEYSGDFIPSIDELQSSIFTQSRTGPYIKDWFSGVLIHTAPINGPVKPGVVDIH